MGFNCSLIIRIIKDVCLGISLIFFSISVKAQSAQQLENLTAFSKAYGYVKYFHPSDEASSIDWGKFSIYGSEQVLKAQSQEELLQSLKSLFGPIAPSVHFEPSGQRLSFDSNQLIPTNTKGYEFTYWQHLGVSKDMGNPSGLYQSVRVNRAEVIDEADNFGNISMGVDAAPFLGKRIKFSGWARIQPGSEGTGHFWVRVDLQDKTTGFFDNMNERPIVENDWKTYETIGTVDEDATGIVFGGFLLGKGEMLLDDLRLFYEEENKWHRVQYVDGFFENGSFDKDNPNNTWGTTGKGYAMEVIPDENRENNRVARIQHVGIYTSKKPSALFKLKPAKGEIWSKEIGGGISMTMPLTLYANRDNTFPQGDKKQLQKLKDDLKGTASAPIDLSFRLGNMINIWNVFQHFYPYFNEIKVDWSVALQNALATSFEDKDGEDHLISLQQFTAKLGDGHLHVSGEMQNDFSPPIHWEWIEGQLVITKVFDPEIDIQRGDRVSHIDGLGVEEYFDRIYQRISSPTEGWRSYRANIISLRGAMDSGMSIRLEGKEVVLKRNLGYQEVQNRNNLKEGYRFLENDIVYLNLDIIPMDSIKMLLPKLKQSRAIIADLRGYPNGNHELITHLLSQKDDKKWMHVSQIIYPDQDRLENYQSFGWSLKPQKPYLGDKKIVFITEGQAISYAESYMGFIEGYKLATIVGQPTAGTNGNINQFQLPGNYSITFTGMKVQKHDGSPLHGVGILPNVYVQKTLAGVKDGRDEFLERAIELANEE